MSGTVSPAPDHVLSMRAVHDPGGAVTNSDPLHASAHLGSTSAAKGERLRASKWQPTAVQSGVCRSTRTVRGEVRRSDRGRPGLATQAELLNFRMALSVRLT